MLSLVISFVLGIVFVFMIAMTFEKLGWFKAGIRRDLAVLNEQAKFGVLVSTSHKVSFVDTWNGQVRINTYYLTDDNENKLKESLEKSFSDSIKIGISKNV